MNWEKVKFKKVFKDLVLSKKELKGSITNEALRSKTSFML